MLWSPAAGRQPCGRLPPARGRAAATEHIAFLLLAKRAPDCTHFLILCSLGDGFAKRAEDAVLHGCLPVQIGDDITDKFETILGWADFTTRIPEADIERVPEILLAYSDAQVGLS